ncbi:MAG: MarR family transcriptional regulator [Lewinella sp.]|nr:MarR family transcriptional regulator [Lewinella sp.]
MKIEEVIQQRKFVNEYHKAQINILYTATWLNQRTAEILKPYGLTWQQFNILRILRGRHPEPATVKLLTERMIDKMSNASRLVDKLLKKGLVERSTCTDDRRRVDVSLTPEGMQMVNQVSQNMERDMERADLGLSPDELIQLNELLDRLRVSEK